MNPKWSHDEELKFIKGISKGDSLKDLAKEHERTETALELRLKKIVYDNIVRKVKPKKLAKMLKLGVEKVKQYYYSYLDFREKNGKSVERVDVDSGVSEKNVSVMLSKNKLMKAKSKVKQSSSKSSTRSSSKSSHKKSTSKHSSKSPKSARTPKSNKSTKSPKSEDSQEKRKFLALKKENKLLKTIIQNDSMKQYIRQMYKTGNLDATTRAVVRKMIKYKLL